MFTRTGSKKSPSWEVVETLSINPLSQYQRSARDLVVQSIAPEDLQGTYQFEIPLHSNASRRHPTQTRENALIFARDQLMGKARALGYNVLLVESWHLTSLRRGKATRVQVKYSGRPGLAATLDSDSSTLSKDLRPPFMAILHSGYSAY